jgi:hypothetical protein
MRWGKRKLFLICRSGLALSVAIWMCSFIREAANPASSALFMVVLMPVPPGCTVVICRTEGGRLQLQ